MFSCFETHGTFDIPLFLLLIEQVKPVIQITLSSARNLKLHSAKLRRLYLPSTAEYTCPVPEAPVDENKIC